MFTLEITRQELDSLKSFIENHNKPCEDCTPDCECGVFLRGACIAKNMDDIMTKLNKLN